jgi:hypothetical protein
LGNPLQDKGGKPSGAENMEWKLSFNEKENILFVKTYGIFDLTTKIELMKECLVVIRKENCRRCLIDNSEIESMRIGTFEIHSIPKWFAKLGVLRDLRIAEVASKKYAEDFNFLETVCRNVGYLVSVFYDIESASQWLKQ